MSQLELLCQVSSLCLRLYLPANWLCQGKQSLGLLSQNVKMENTLGFRC